MFFLFIFNMIHSNLVLVIHLKKSIGLEINRSCEINTKRKK